MVMLAAFFDNYSFFFLATRRPCHATKKWRQGFVGKRNVCEALTCSVTRQTPEHCCSAASVFHIVRPFIHFGSKSSHSVVTLHYTHHHCSVHWEAILLPIQWQRERAQNQLNSTESAWFGCRPAKFVVEMKFLSSPANQGSDRMLHFTLYIFRPGI